MKKIFLFASMLAVAASCTVSEIDSEKRITAPEITVSYENNGTKTAITTDNEGVGTIWWKPADEINVFYGTTSTHYTSKNTENATTVSFGTTDVIGSTESASENIWGLYPFDEDAVCDGESVTTTIPTAQKGVAGTFDDDIFTSLAHSTSTTMTFYNVLGGIKFSLSRDDIQSITFKGNNDENIAGKVSLSMDTNGKPVAEITEGEKTITLTPKEGTAFAKNTNYYIVMLPTVLSNGFTMTFVTETEIGTFEYTAKSIEIKRSVFSKKDNIDTFAEFAANIDQLVLSRTFVKLQENNFFVLAAESLENGEKPDVIFSSNNTEVVDIVDLAGNVDVNKNQALLYFKSPGSAVVTATYAGNKAITEDCDICVESSADLSCQYVDFGTSVKWATCNLGAANAYERGNRFAWGEIESKTNYTWGNYKWCNGTMSSLTKYNSNSSSGYVDNKKTLDMEDDAANAALGSNWRIPRSSEWEELKKITTYIEDVTYCGATGIIYYDVNGNCIFLPNDPERSYGLYWTNTLSTSSSYACSWDTEDYSDSDSRMTGLLIRPVADCLHSLDKINGKLPTMDSSGWKDYYKCTLCSQYYEDSDGNVLIGNETALNNWKSENGHGYIEPLGDYVDLGLSVKWATCNLGAAEPEAFGDYYAWGEFSKYYNGGYEDGMRWKTGKEAGYDWPSYKWCNGTDQTLIKYNTMSSYGQVVDNKTTLDVSDDAAYVNLGNNWRIPTKEEWNELISECNCDPYSLNGVVGYKISSKKAGYTDKWIFLPAAGYWTFNDQYRSGKGQLAYWTSSLRTDQPHRAYGIYNLTLSSYQRTTGFTIRPVYIH